MDTKRSAVIGDRYRISDTIGRGGMGTVYRAEDVITGKLVALKRLRPKLMDNARVVERFVNESQIAQTIRHENVCEVLDVGTDRDGIPYFVMPLLKGATLSDLLKETDEPLPVEKAVIICAQVLAALAAAHDRQIIHRDLTPKNIIVQENEGETDVKLVDFGISKIISQDSTGTSITGISIGTTFYMAPEQAAGQAVDKRADIYSVGVMLYEALTGQRPFQSDSKAETMYKFTSKPPKAPRRINKEIAKSVERVVLKAMAHDPNKRYSSTAEMSVALMLAIGKGREKQKTLERLTNTFENTAGDIPAFGEASAVALEQMKRRLFYSYAIIACLAVAIITLGIIFVL